MTDKEKQERLEQLAVEYLTAVAKGNFDIIEAMWEKAEVEPVLAEMLHGLNVELVAAQEAAERNAISGDIVAAIEKHMPSAEVLHRPSGPLTAADVANYLSKHPPGGITVDELRVNDVLRKSDEPIPGELGLSEVKSWGRKFGSASESYWKAFRAAALKLLMQRESAENYQMAARPQKPKPHEGTP